MDLKVIKPSIYLTPKSLEKKTLIEKAKLFSEETTPFVKTVD